MRVLPLLLSSLFVPTLLIAQQVPDWAKPYEPSPQERAAQAGGPEMPDAPEAVPVDGGLTLLAAAGAGYALHRLRRRKQGKEHLRIR